MANLLLVEDDASVRQIVMLQLSLVGYDVRAAEDAGQARRMMEEKTPDLAILDIMLPGEDGFSLAETMMERAVPVLFLTAKTAVSDRVRGLRMGAEDYIVKPFEVVELLARVDVVLRRYNKTDAVIEIGGLRIDTRAMQVWRGAEEISLTHKEYDLLLFFARNPGTALYRETIYEHVWGGEYSYGSKTVDLHIQRLRKKVGWENRLLAVNKVGYRLEV